MEQEKYELEGYRFFTKNRYMEAKKEWEAIAYLKEKTDLKKGENALKLYNQLGNKQYFHTVIGYDFLKELAETAIESGVITRERLLPIGVEEKKAEQTAPKPDKSIRQLEKEAENYRMRYEDLKAKKDCSKIVILFLVLMLAACVVITLLSDNTLVTDYRSKVENEYVEWQEQLKEKEEQLEEREEQLNEREAELSGKMNENPDTFTE